MAPERDVSEERLEHLKEGIEAARRQAEEHGTLPSHQHHQTFIDPDADDEITDEDEHPGDTMGF